jgi:hypothetical protein
MTMDTNGLIAMWRWRLGTEVPGGGGLAMAARRWGPALAARRRER